MTESLFDYYENIIKKQEYKTFGMVSIAKSEKYSGVGYIVDWVCAIFWMENGELHRLDGLAYISKQTYGYWIHNKSYSEQQYWNHPLVIKHKLEKIMNL
mgnify:CR=1 FL=1